MKITVKILSVVLVLAMCFAFVACGSTPNNGGNDYPTSPVDKYADIENYDELSEKIYEDVLGDFYAIYAEAKAETTNISRRYALMAKSGLARGQRDSEAEKLRILAGRFGRAR